MRGNLRLTRFRSLQLCPSCGAWPVRCSRMAGTRTLSHARALFLQRPFCYTVCKPPLGWLAVQVRPLFRPLRWQMRQLRASLLSLRAVLEPSAAAKRTSWQNWEFPWPINCASSAYHNRKFGCANGCRCKRTTNNDMHPKRHPSVMGEMCYFPFSFPVVFLHFSKQSRRHPSKDSFLPVKHPQTPRRQVRSVLAGFSPSADTADTMKPPPRWPFPGSADKCRRHVGVMVSVRRHPQTSADIRRHGQRLTFLEWNPIVMLLSPPSQPVGCVELPVEAMHSVDTREIPWCDFLA